MFQLTKSLIYFCYFEGTNFPLFSAVSFAGDKMCRAVRHILFFLFLSAKYSTSKSLVRTAASFSRFRRETEEGRILDNTQREREARLETWLTRKQLETPKGARKKQLSSLWRGRAGGQTDCCLLAPSSQLLIPGSTYYRERARKPLDCSSRFSISACWLDDFPNSTRCTWRK